MTTIDNNLESLADEFGQLKAAKAKADKRQKEIKKIFQDANVHALEGKLFRVVASDVDDAYGVDWEKIARKLGATDKMIEHPANQKVTRAGSYRVSVYARTGDD